MCVFHCWYCHVRFFTKHFLFKMNAIKNLHFGKVCAIFKVTTEFFVSGWVEIIYLSFSDGSWRISDFNFTNSLATSSLLRCQRILRIVQPVSSLGMLLNSGNQRAHERWKRIMEILNYFQTLKFTWSTISFSWSTATPTRRSSRAKQ